MFLLIILLVVQMIPNCIKNKNTLVIFKVFFIGDMLLCNTIYLPYGKCDIRLRLAI